MVVRQTWCLCGRLNRPMGMFNAVVPFSDFRSVISKHLGPSRNFIDFSYYDDTLARCEEESTLLSLCEGPTPIGRYRSCAVVGHGATFSKGRCEGAISKHDFVIRCNLPLNDEHYTNYRQQTNLTIVDFETLRKLDESILLRNKRTKRNPLADLNSPSLLSKLQKLQTLVIAYMGDFEPYAFGAGKAKDEMCSNINDDMKAQNIRATLTFSVEPLRDISRRILRRFNIRLQEPPSAALMSVLLALSFCDSVSLYGNTTSGKDFHYNQVKPLHFRNRQYTVEDESHLLQRLHNQGDIKLLGFCKDS
ncbi:alpha-2,8-sialyltransferase 8B-like [Branchiostoma floridae]|uniref:Alpha-2,8-sialyltransferase 8B-like n=1 Tax=Branchiostoma floridae TaxID=7739 RepID=A0A9J7KWC5_BRAFL|nr:alpha-2,8-sialyltransferase 8B-like [Branchiostoma floridae]